MHEIVNDNVAVFLIAVFFFFFLRIRFYKIYKTPPRINHDDLWNRDLSVYKWIEIIGERLILPRNQVSKRKIFIS